MNDPCLDLCYSINETEKKLLLANRVKNKRYLTKQIRMIDVYKENVEDLKIILKNMYLVDDIKLEYVKSLQKKLKTKKHVEEFIEEFRNHTYKTGFTPFILHT